MYPIVFESFVKLYFCFLAVFESLTGMLFYVVNLLIKPTSASCTETPHIYYHKSTFNDHLLDNCISLHSFTPSPWAIGPIAQTVFSVFQIGCSKYQKREILTTNEGLPLILDIKLPTSSEKHHHSPIVVILHGTGGSSQSGLGRLLADEAVKQGWHAIVVNKRGYGKGLQIFPSHTQTPDIQLVSDYVTNTYPHSKKILFGYSQGGNSIVHYLGHMSKQNLKTPYSGAICISCAFDIEIGTQMLAKSRKFANILLTSQCKNILINELPFLRRQCKNEGIIIDIEKAISCHDIRTFDHIMMIAPYLEKNKEGNKCVDEYYRRESCHHVLKYVDIPLLCINSDDDPIIPKQLLDIAGPTSFSEPLLNVISVRTKRGGHLGWIENVWGESWLSKIMIQFTNIICTTTTTTKSS